MKSVDFTAGFHIEFVPFNPTDKVPEYRTYKDEGCRYSKSCLECPLPQCVHDVSPGKGVGSASRISRDDEIVRLYSEEQLTVQELAIRFKLSRPTIYAALKKNKEK